MTILRRDRACASGGRPAAGRALWHGDVCHFAIEVTGAKQLPACIHGHLDDAARYIVGPRGLLAGAGGKTCSSFSFDARVERLRRTADALYLDNGATYRGKS
jgi:hypothetical protein